MPGTGFPDIQPALRSTYKERAERITYPKKALLATLRKETDFGGDDYRYAVRFEHGGGRSANFAKALANKSPVKFKRFTAQRAEEFYIGEVTGAALEASAETKWSQANALEEEFDSGAENGAEAINQALYRDGSGVIGTINSAINSATIALSQRFDLRSFFVGQKLQAANPVGPALRTGGAAIAEIAKVDPSAGTITFTAALNTLITDVVNGDLLINDGDFNAKMQGLQAHVPAVVSGADSFRGVNRSDHRIRLAGIFVDGGGGHKEEVLEQAIAEALIWGSDPDVGFINPDDMREIKILNGNKVTIVKDQTEKAWNMPTISFAAVGVGFGSKLVKLMEDGDCPKGETFFLNRRTSYLKSLGKAPKFLNWDMLTKQILRATNADAYEYRMGMRGNFICERPIDLIRIKW
jgi:hypothetical protein